MTTSVKAKFRPSRVKGKAGAIYFRVIHDRVARQIGTGYKLYPEEWKNGEVMLPEHDTERGSYLAKVALNLQTMKKQVEAAIRCLDEAGKPYTCDDVVAAYLLPHDDGRSLRAFSYKLAEHLKRTGQHRLAETYTSSVNSFLRFRGEQGDIRLDEIDEDLIKEYEYYLLEECKLCRNTSSFYNRNLRAIYNRAVKKKLTIDRHPFSEVYTGVDKTAKRALPIQTVKDIKDLDFGEDTEMAFTRDLYLMSFDLRGISFVDLAMLETDQLKNRPVEKRLLDVLSPKDPAETRNQVGKTDAGDCGPIPRGRLPLSVAHPQRGWWRPEAAIPERPAPDEPPTEEDRQIGKLSYPADNIYGPPLLGQRSLSAEHTHLVHQSGIGA